MKFTALLLPVLVSAAPETFQSFTADLEQTTALELASIKSNFVMTGKMSVSAPLNRVRTDINKVVFELEASAIPDVALPGLPAGGSDAGGSDGQVISANAVELLRYDIGKNFTWFTEGGKTTCSCTDLKGQMRPFFVDATATTAGDEVLTIDEKLVETQKYTSGLKMNLGAGLDGGVTVTYNVKDKALRQLKISSSVGVAELGLKSDLSFKFWNVKEVKGVEGVATWSKPDPSCSCPSAEPPVIIVAETYPAKADACTAASGCKCVVASTAANPTIEFCKDIVSWPIAEVLFPKTVDEFVKTVHETQSALGPVGDKCATDYKEFLCKFYFQICEDKGKLSAPPTFDTCVVDSIETSGYDDVANLAAGKSADGKVVPGVPGNDSESGAFTVGVSPLVGLAVAALLL